MLIVGAGISGLTLARAMRLLPSAADWNIDLVERSRRFEPAGCGIVLHPNGCSALSRVGLFDQVATRASRVRRMEIRRGAAAMVLDLEEVWAGAGYPTLGIARPALHEMLAGAALAEGDGRPSLRLGCDLASLDQSAPRPIATFRDGSREAYDLVVGADGAHSSVRRAIAPEIAAAPTGSAYIRFLAENSIGMPEDRWLVFEQPEYVHGFIPVGGNRLHCFIQIGASAAPGTCEAEEIIEAVAGSHSDFAACLKHASPLHVHAAYMVSPIAWARGRCVLIGDASHAVAPSLSEGGALAMEDGLALASALETHLSIDEALAGFVAARQAPIAWAQRMSRAQVNARRRPGTSPLADPAAATKHMRCMYEPLRRGAARAGDGAAPWWLEKAPSSERNSHDHGEQREPSRPGFCGHIARQDERQEARRDCPPRPENGQERKRHQVDAAVGRALVDQVGGQVSGPLAGQDGRLAG